MKLFYKLHLNIKLWYIWCLHAKILNKSPITNSCCKPAKTMLFDWMTLWKFLIFIIRFSPGETDQISGASSVFFQWSNLVKLYPLDPPTLDFFVDFHWDMSGNGIYIYKLCYHTVVLKKIAKTFTSFSFRTLKLGQQRSCPKSSSIFFSGDNKRRP